MSIVANLRDAILSILVLIILTITFLILVLPLSVLLMYRWTVSKSCRLFKPELYKILSPFSAIYLQSEIDKEERGNIITTSKFGGGKFTKDEILSRLPNLFESGNGQPIYPELKMYTVYWMGYGFWKPEENFQIEDHFSGPVIISSENEDEFISKCETESLKTPFPPGKSPWEIILIEGHTNSYIIFKCHHSLGDGSTFLRVWSKLMDNQLSVYDPAEFSTNWMIKSWLFISFPFMVAYDIVKMIPHILAPPNPWEMNVKDMSEDTRVIFKSKELIFCEQIREIRKANQVTFTAVLVSAISGGIRNTLEKQGKKCPDSVTVTNLLPLPGHPDKMTNHFASCPLNLPVGELDKIQRLKKCEIELQQCKKSKLPIMATFLIRILGSLPHCVLIHLSPAKYVPPIQISNIAGPNTVMQMLGHPILDVTFNLRIGRTLPVFLTMLSYNGQIRISVNVDPGIFTNENSVQEFVSEIQNELKAMME